MPTLPTPHLPAEWPRVALPPHLHPVIYFLSFPVFSGHPVPGNLLGRSGEITRPPRLCIISLFQQFLIVSILFLIFAVQPIHLSSLSHTFPPLIRERLMHNRARDPRRHIHPQVTGPTCPHKHDTA